MLCITGTHYEKCDLAKGYIDMNDVELVTLQGPASTINNQNRKDKAMQLLGNDIRHHKNTSSQKDIAVGILKQVGGIDNDVWREQLFEPVLTGLYNDDSEGSFMSNENPLAKMNQELENWKGRSLKL